VPIDDEGDQHAIVWIAACEMAGMVDWVNQPSWRRHRDLAFASSQFFAENGVGRALRAYDGFKLLLNLKVGCGYRRVVVLDRGRITAAKAAQTDGVCGIGEMEGEFEVVCELPHGAIPNVRPRSDSRWIAMPKGRPRYICVGS